MSTNHNFINNLNKKITEKDYFSSIQMLKKEIIKIYIEKIKQINPSYNYTSLLGLLDNVEKHLNEEEFFLFKKYYILTNEENNKLYELDSLLTIYNNLKKGGIFNLPKNVN